MKKLTLIAVGFLILYSCITDDTDSENPDPNSESPELINQLKLLSNDQILDFNGLPISYFTQFDSFCNNHMQIFSFNYDDETEGANNIDIQISSESGASTIADDTYNLLDGECNYAAVDFFHADLFTNNEDGYLQNGTIKVSENGNNFYITGELIKITFNGSTEIETSLGAVIGRFLSE